MHRNYPKPGDYRWIAGHLAREPLEKRFDNHDGTIETIIYLTVAVNHAARKTEYIDVEARGMQRIYVENRMASPHRPLHKGEFVIVGGVPSRKPHTLLLRIFATDTSYGFEPLEGWPTSAGTDRKKDVGENV